MYLLGYHGTSPTAAIGLTSFGPKKSHFYAALGSGLYVARECGFLVEFFSKVATQRDSYMIMENDAENSGVVAESERLQDGITVLKIYSTVPLQQLKNCVWDIMDLSQGGISPRDNLNDLSGFANNLQMVIPEEYFPYIHAIYCNTKTDNNERPVPWPINEWPKIEPRTYRRRYSI